MDDTLFPQAQEKEGMFSVPHSDVMPPFGNRCCIFDRPIMDASPGPDINHGTMVYFLRLRRLRGGAATIASALLCGCHRTVFDAAGYIAHQQSRLVVTSTLLMLLIIIPVILLTLFFAWHYRQSNADADYRPDWDRSLHLELAIWAAPLLIVIALGALTWIGSHTLDPFRPLRRVDANRTVAAGVRPLTVDVVALDWKWLFIYPKQGIAVVNEAAAPIDVPIRFRITSQSVMNAFFIPALAGQIYAMPGMRSELNAVINRPGEFRGFSSSYSGAGFSHMEFRFLGMTSERFAQWIQRNRDASARLDRETYLRLVRPSIADPVRRYGSIDPAIFRSIVDRCIGSPRSCPPPAHTTPSRAAMADGAAE